MQQSGSLLLLLLVVLEVALVGLLMLLLKVVKVSPAGVLMDGHRLDLMASMQMMLLSMDLMDWKRLNGLGILGLLGHDDIMRIRTTVGHFSSRIGVPYRHNMVLFAAQHARAFLDERQQSLRVRDWSGANYDDVYFVDYERQSKTSCQPALTEPPGQD